MLTAVNIASADIIHLVFEKCDSSNRGEVKTTHVAFYPKPLYQQIQHKHIFLGFILDISSFIIHRTFQNFYLVSDSVAVAWPLVFSRMSCIITERKHSTPTNQQ